MANASLTVSNSEDAVCKEWINKTERLFAQGGDIFDK